LISVESSFVLGDEALALSVCTNGRHTSESLLERGEDWTLGSSIESLEFSRSRKVVGLDAAIDEKDGNEDEEESGSRR